MKIEPHFHFKEELQIGFGFEIWKWSTNYEIPLQPLLPGRSSSCRSPIWQQRFYLTKWNTCDVNLLNHFLELLFLLRASHLLLTEIKTDFIEDKILSMNESINKKQQPFPKRFPTEYPTWNVNKSPSSCLSMTLEKCAPPSDSTQSVNLITEDRAHEKDNKTCNGPLQSDMFGNSTSVLGTPIRNAQRQRIQLHRSKTPLQPQYELIRIGEFRNPFQYAASNLNVMSRNDADKLTNYYERISITNNVTLRSHSDAECEPTYERQTSNSTTFFKWTQ